MCKIYYKFMKNESYRMFTNICKLYLANFLKNLAQNDFKNLSYETILIESKKM
jgi:hypothetical protein